MNYVISRLLKVAFQLSFIRYFLLIVNNVNFVETFERSLLLIFIDLKF